MEASPFSRRPTEVNVREGEHKELAPAYFGSRKDISHVVVIKDRDLFFLTETDGCVPTAERHGFGLFYHDCRFLNGYEFLIGGSRPEHLAWNAESGYMAVIALTNPEIVDSRGNTILRHNIGIRWARLIDGSRLALHDVITFQNLTFTNVEFGFSLTFRAAFEDLFEIRGMSRQRVGTIHSPRNIGKRLELQYDGADGIYRCSTIEFLEEPRECDGQTCVFDVHLPPNQSRDFQVSIHVSESSDPARVPQTHLASFDLSRIEAALRKQSANWLEAGTELYTNSISLNRTVRRSILDLNMLRSYIDGEEYFAAGIPWFVALFGRDSIITALQMLAFDLRLAEHTILLLARFQGKSVDERRDEEPGKILHELRVGEMANLNEVPHTPYYGSVDATPLFLILIGRHAAWSGRLDLFKALKPNIEAALDWMSRYGDISGSGYLEYERKAHRGLANQGWKDSYDAIVNADGSLAAAPIALVEVQGYVYQAKLEMAALYRRAGEVETAERLESEAGDLKQRFNRDFWASDGFYALALQQGGKQAAVMSSNAGHALWACIADGDKARQTVERLMSDDMFSGWGIRTLSERERRYNPLGYHLGTVWPHDNCLILGGMRKYGFNDEALRLFTAMLDAASFFDARRLPELFAGLSKARFGVPVNYPVACQPQAWAAGTVPHMVKLMLGLVPEGFDNRLRIRRPVLPPFISEVEIRRLRVGAGAVDLKFERTSDTVAVKVLHCEDQLEVVLEL